MHTVMKWLLITILLSSNSASAGTLALSAGTGLDDTLIQSGNITSTSVSGLLFDTIIDDEVSVFGYEFALSLEFSGFKLKGQHKGLEENMNIFQIKPKLRWQSDLNMHLDVGLGLASLSEPRWEEIIYGDQILFALSFGVGWHFGQQQQFSVDLVYNHYSNGYTSSPNPGLDFVTLNIGYEF